MPTSKLVDLRPMQRLLSEADTAFVAGQPGYKPELQARLRSSRVRLFRGYLALLEKEFLALHATLRQLTLTAPMDRPEVAKFLIRQRVQFAVNMAKVRFRLLLFRFGIAVPEVSSLVQAVESLRVEVQRYARS
ncbi:MAG: hypothetical protein HYZ37_10595 [Candidatus Solibacter usitatus]|nr:hypothetical protein [Candidatus Solibacter usitatus]